MWHVRRTPAISTDDRSLYRALVNCWSYSAGLTNGESLDIELAMVVKKIMTRLDSNHYIDLGLELLDVADYADDFERCNTESKNDRLLTEFESELYRTHYSYVEQYSEREYSDRNAD